MKALGKQAQRGRDRIAAAEAHKKHEEYLKWFESLSEEEKAKHLAEKEASHKRARLALQTLGLMSAMAGPYGSSRELKEIMKLTKGNEEQ